MVVHPDHLKKLPKAEKGSPLGTKARVLPSPKLPPLAEEEGEVQAPATPRHFRLPPCHSRLHGHDAGGIGQRIECGHFFPSLRPSPSRGEGEE